MKNKFRFIKSLALLLSASIALTSCGSFQEGWNNVKDWFAKIGNNIYDFATGPLSDWWGGVMEGATKIYDDVSSWVVETTNTVKTNVCDFYTEVKGGIITFYNDVVDSVTIREASRSTADYELYKNDPETLAYSLISSQLSDAYEVFPAYIYHPETNEVIDGLGFSDLSEVYKTNDDVGYFFSGFVSGNGEETVTDEMIKNGIEIYRPEDEGENKYIYAYTLDPAKTHFIANKKYVTCEINDKHAIAIESKDTTEYKSENEYGALYDYDNKKYVFGEKNEFLTTTGNLIDKNNLNILDATKAATNDVGGSGFTMSLQSLIVCASNSIYLLKQKIAELNSSTFLGANIGDLTSSLSGVKASDIFTSSENGFTFQKMPNVINGQDTTNLAKTLSIAMTVMSVIFSFAVTIFSKTWIGKLVSLGAGAMVGFSMELMTQLLFEKRTIQEVNWGSLIIRSVVGGISALTGSVLGSALIGAVADSAVDFVFEGGTILDGMLIFAKSFITSLIVAGVMKLVSVAANKAVSGIKKLVNKARNRPAKIAEKQLTKASDEFADEMRKTAKSTSSSSSSDADDEFLKKTVKQALADKNKDFIKVDKNGNEITKKGGFLKNALKNGEEIYIRPKPDCDPEILEKMAKCGLGKNDSIAMIKGKYTIFSAKLGEIDVGPDVIGKLTRGKTFSNADDAMLRFWADNPSKIPSEVNNFLKAQGKTIETATPQTIKQMRSALGLTWHEVSAQSLQLVPTLIHKSISHSGGVAFVKIMVALNNGQALILALGGA